MELIIWVTIIEVNPGLERLATLPLTIADKYFILMVEGGIGLRPTTITHKAHVAMVDF